MSHSGDCEQEAQVAATGTLQGLRSWCSYFERYVREARLAGVTDPDRDGALQRFRLALAKAWELCGERDTLADRIPKPAAMSFNGLASRLSPEGEASIQYTRMERG